MMLDNIIPELCEEIYQKLALKEKSQEYNLGMEKKHEEDLIDLTNLHSWWLEFPALKRKIFTIGKSEREIKRALKRESRSGAKRVKLAWKFLRAYPQLSDNLNHKLIVDLGNIVEPDNEQAQNLGNLVLGNNEGYRTGSVTLGIPGYTPPNARKVPELMTKLFEEVKTISNPIEAAIYLHLRVAGIQPLKYDGNKRTSRLLQNRILYENNLPPATVPIGERTHYIETLSEALIGHQEEDIKKMRPLYTYLAGKVNSHLDQRTI
ncbi:Fic family protein [Candidatus Woesearchaeota archaeon]|jgi:hypothetical protein|nr:Fic family protein [Candidatus Woesearchaeota archaeon]